MPALLSLDGVCKTHRRGRHANVVLDRVSFHVGVGEFAAIFGRRGAGKTTLLRIAAGLDAPDAGRVTLDGRDLLATGRRRRLDGLPDGIGWLVRSGPLTRSMPMLDFVAMPLLERVPHREARRRAGAALERATAGALVDARWPELSDAERVLVALARATVRRPALLLADDPTAGLGTREREIVLGLLREATDENEMSALITVPALPDVLRAHRVMSLSGGELMEPTRQRTGDHLVVAADRRESV
ncbi:ATP-binding cassette domain-containing protein [Conexibacter arvalis]|uniref:Putative ABC transport system ATP-binding protein n=1 Tax=Conexibacter arvalis TaxID=912552 RepID=A0A840ILA4_9ACTN|nr:ATP-binding cassette domain-containing protein [Conexibacter arvalis]MBB4665115.1 putative ABC transport system ATP-binding protein [Conexibacter arvalis]